MRSRVKRKKIYETYQMEEQYMPMKEDKKRKEIQQWTKPMAIVSYM